METTLRPRPGPALAAAIRALRPSGSLTRPAVFLLELAALGCAYAAFVAPAERVVDGAEAAGLFLTAFCVSLIPALAESGAQARSRAWRAAGRGARTKQAFTDGSEESGDADLLQKGQLIVAAAGERIPCDGLVIEGAATVDESALTGESAPVLRDATPGRERVIGGTKVLSDRLKIRVDGAPGEGLLGRLGTRVGGPLGRFAAREGALAALALLVGAALLGPRLGGASLPAALQDRVAAAALAALLLPTALTAFAGTAGSLGTRRLLRRGIVARDARAADAASRARAAVLEESAAATGRWRAVEFIPATGIPEAVLADAAQLASLADESPEGRSIVVLAKAKGLRGRRLADLKEARFLAPAPHTRVGGFDAVELFYRKGPAASLAGLSGGYGPDIASFIDRIARTGGQAITIAISGRALGLVHMREPEPVLRNRLARLRAEGGRAVLAVRAASSAVSGLAAELGIDEIVVAAAPAARAAAVEKMKAAGSRTAASADAAVDEAVLAAADVGLARGLRTTPSADAALLDLNDDPEKIVDALVAARAARRTRAVVDAAAWACDALKGAAAALLLARALSADPSSASMGAVLALTAAGLAPLLLLTVGAFSGFI
jgi:K+-transporting ATPase ATPase B chain